MRHMPEPQPSGAAGSEPTPSFSPLYQQIKSLLVSRLQAGEWLPGALFKGLTAERLAAWRGPMYRLFEAEFAVHMIRAEEKLRAVAAQADEAALLGVNAGTPLLSVERLSFTYGDRPVELRRGLYHTDNHHYRNQLS